MSGGDVLVGVVSDTHGLLRPEVCVALRGCARILHAGDVGDPAILDELEAVAPVDAVRGNVDLEPPLSRLPEALRLELGGLQVGVTHREEDVDGLGLGDCDLLVFGHSHEPTLRWCGRRLRLNPGSCGRRRFRLPATVARVRFTGGRMVPEILAVE